VAKCSEDIEKELLESSLYTETNRKEKLLELCRGFGEHIIGRIWQEAYVKEAYEQMGKNIMATKPMHLVSDGGVSRQVLDPTSNHSSCHLNSQVLV
jgi:hypothetical protein